MGAIRNEFGVREALRLSINAGVDILMFANNVQEDQYITAPQIHELINDLLFEREITEEQIRTSYKRIMKLKAEIGLLEEGYYKGLKTKLKPFK